MIDETLIKVLTEQGVLLTIVLLVLWFVYKYIMMKFERMRREIDEAFKQKKYSLKGNISIFPDDENPKIFVNLNVEEIQE
ncbi:MAG: hypothetical protein ACPGXZ_14065 [Saprospiraceae bacterium]